MKFLALAALALIPFHAAQADAPKSTTANVPTGYQVAGAVDYRLTNGPNWHVAQIKDTCSARELGRSDSKCVTVGSHAGDSASATK